MVVGTRREAGGRVRRRQCEFAASRRRESIHS